MTMDDPILPAVRIPIVAADQSKDGESSQQETPLVDLPSSEKFGFAWPESAATVNPPMTGASVLASLPIVAPTESTSETSDIDSSDPEQQPAISRGHTSPVLQRDIPDQHTPSIESEATLTPIPHTPPRLSRAFSMPLPSQLGYLKNPYKPSSSIPYTPTFPLVSPNSQQNKTKFQDVSVELADSVQMVIQTLLQISPPHLLDPAKEQFAACSLSVPSPSISAMLTTMKTLNYMSANMHDFTESGSLDTINESGYTELDDEFDVGEILQSVGDALSGLASQAGVDLVLFHADVGMKHVCVKGDECGLSYALSHVIRQVIDTAQSGDSIEIGLYITADGVRRSESRAASDVEDEGRSSSRASSLFPDFDGPIRCTFDIAHKFSSPDTTGITPAESERIIPNPNPSPVLVRTRPNLDSLILRRLLRRINGTIKPDLAPKLFAPGRSTELTVLVEAGSPDLLAKPPSFTPEEEAARQPFINANIQLAAEPSLEELLSFLDTLKGKKVALYASGKGSFAHHMTSYLTAWGLDVSHMSGSGPAVDVAEGLEDDTKNRRHSTDTLTGDWTRAMATLTESPVVEASDVLDDPLRSDAESDGTIRPAFIMIDDDVDALRRQLTRLRSEAPYNGQGGVNMNLKLNSTIVNRRPNLATMHRPKSSSQVTRAKLARQGQVQPVTPPPVIIHFTSLSNFKLVKDVIHSVLSSSASQGAHSAVSCPIPEVIVIPKPAGPRRLLVALRTALTKPIVDPFFSPIATSPISPANGLAFSGPLSPFSWGNMMGWNQGGNVSPSNHPHVSSHRAPVRPPLSPRTASDRSQRSGGPKETGDHGYMPAHRPGLPPSPLGQPDSMEYFSEAALKLGTSPSSGLVIQSPNGQPAGIFFHPRGAENKTSRTGKESIGTTGIQPPMLVRDNGNLKPPGEPYRPSPRRKVVENEPGPSRPAFTRQRSSLGQRAADGTNTQTESPAAALCAAATATALAGRTKRPTPRLEERSDSRHGTTVVSSAQSAVSGSPEVPPPISSSFSPRQRAVDSISRRTTSPPAVPMQRLTTTGTAATSSPSTSPTAVGPISTAAIGGLIPSPTAAQSRRPARRTTDTSENTKKGKGSDSNIVPPINVLIVEDNPINQTILTTFMKKKRIKYDTAKNGAEAVAKWKSGGFHLILMDIQMPVMDGIEATKEIRRLERLGMFGAPMTPSQEAQRTPSDAASSESRGSGGVHTPFSSSVIIVALTAYTLPSDRLEALGAGCNDFLSKPVSLEWLNNKIIEWGSIKALQMWADFRPDVAKNIASGQVAKARTVASKLQLPEKRKLSQAKSSGIATHEQPSSPNPVESTAPRSYEEAIQKLAQSNEPVRELTLDESLGANLPRDEEQSISDDVHREQPQQASAIPNTDADDASSEAMPLLQPSDSSQPLDAATRQPSSRPTRTLGGKQALLAHLRNVYGNKQGEGQRPGFLTTRATVSGIPSIAEVMQGSSGSSPTSGTPGVTSSDPVNLPYIPEAEFGGDTEANHLNGDNDPFATQSQH